MVFDDICVISGLFVKILLLVISFEVNCISIKIKNVIII